LEKPELIIFKKTIGKKIVGFVEFEMKEDAGFINAVVVQENQRGLGFGKELLEYALKKIIELGANKARLMVKQENMAAKKLYESQGFELIGVREKKIDESIIEIWEKNLAIIN